VQQVSENNFTAREESSVGLPILSVTGIGLDSNWNSPSQAFSKLSSIPIYSLYRKSEKNFKIQIA
jgi:hypothetical protein